MDQCYAAHHPGSSASVGSETWSSPSKCPTLSPVLRVSWIRQRRTCHQHETQGNPKGTCFRRRCCLNRLQSYQDSQRADEVGCTVRLFLSAAIWVPPDVRNTRSQFCGSVRLQQLEGRFCCALTFIILQPGRPEEVCNALLWHVWAVWGTLHCTRISSS